MTVGRAAWGALPDEARTPSAWLLEFALRQGGGVAPSRAALAAELGRRAGVAVHTARLRGCWAIQVPGEPVGVALDVGADAETRRARRLRGCVCGHPFAFVVITSLADAWQSAGTVAQARRARVLRLVLSHGGAV
jgi:hypothetical protein